MRTAGPAVALRGPGGAQTTWTVTPALWEHPFLSIPQGGLALTLTPPALCLQKLLEAHEEQNVDSYTESVSGRSWPVGPQYRLTTPRAPSLHSIFCNLWPLGPDVIAFPQPPASECPRVAPGGAHCTAQGGLRPWREGRLAMGPWGPHPVSAPKIQGGVQICTLPSTLGTVPGWLRSGVLGTQEERTGEQQQVERRKEQRTPPLPREPHTPPVWTSLPFLAVF